MENKSDTVVASAPGRIDLSGGPTDWCGMNTLAMAINLRAYAKVTKLDNAKKIAISIGDQHVEYEEPVYDGNLDLFKAVIELSGLKGFAVEYWTDIPKGSGLGGSAPLTVATLFALNKLFDMNWSKYYMAELAQRAETLKLQTVQGYQDQYSAMFGGLLFLDFKGKACQRGDYSKPIEVEPYTTVENLNNYLPEFNAIVAIPKVTRTSSNETNGSLSDRYLDNETLIVDSMNQMAKLAQEAKKALIDKKNMDLYRIINADNDIHRIFNFVSGDNEMIIDVANQNGALACNVCGAGRGAVALFAKDQADAAKIFAALKDKVENIYYVKLDEGARYEQE